MRHLGYVCINESLRPKNYKNIRLNSIKTKGIEYLEKRTIQNFKHLEKVINFNIKNGIYFYRVPSYIIPFATHPLVTDKIGWHFSQVKEIVESMKRVKQKVKKHNLRLSAHPDQFTILNSKKDHVVKNSIKFLHHHGEFLEKLGGTDIIVHIGGVYGDKPNSKKRFVKNFKKLNKNTKEKLRIENDDTSYNLKDVCEVSEITNIPIVFDFHHNRCLPSKNTNLNKLIKSVKNSWNGKIPKCHISTGESQPSDKKHADYISIKDLMALEKIMKNTKYDLMLEARKKEKALFKLRKEYQKR
ncbi:MAG: UV DNA damage repair endonuclease UvsE [Bacillota bacterium]